MKIALVIPPWRPEDIFPSKTASVQINYWQPLGTLYVASVLMEAGHDVKFLNGAFLCEEEILSSLQDFEPRIVGLYSTTFGWKRACAMARAIKREMGDPFIVAGGPYPIAIKGACLEDCESMDAVVTGEGEITMVDLAEAINHGRDLSNVKGLVYRTEGRIIENPPMPLIEDLDTLPFPARELLGHPDLYIPPPATYRRKPVAVIITSRGCNRRCIFCFQIDRYREKGIRYRSVDNVIKEIEHCLSQGYREIKFIDDTLASDYGRALELAQEIKGRRLDFTWFASACVNQVDRRLLRAFKEAGCWAILMGAESGVQKNLNTLRKGITLEQIKRAVKAAKEEGLRVFTPFLIGIPGETYEEALQTIEFACELDPDVANFHALTPFPGTELYDRANEYGHISTDLEDYTYQGAAFIPRSMTREEIIELRQIAFRRFYSRPRFLLRRILGLRNIQDLRVAFRGIRSLFWLWVKRDVFHRTESYS
ncbi:MAG: radical SAM protein [Nitrospirae bacterium]|nr:radical SAM protein [Nitrospirota bacterium]